MAKIRKNQSIKYRRKGDIIISDAISSSSLCNMSEDAIVVVNRVKLSARLVECEIKGDPKNKEVEMILRRAVKEVRCQDLKSRKFSIGAIMTVGEVMKVFEKPEIFRDNTFYAVEVK